MKTCVSLLAAIVVCVPAIGEEPASEQALRKRIDSYVDAFNKADSSGVANHWAEGAVRSVLSLPGIVVPGTAMLGRLQCRGAGCDGVVAILWPGLARPVFLFPYLTCCLIQAGHLGLTMHLSRPCRLLCLQ